MNIKSITIENFRGIQNQTVNDIQSALILIGKNNAGKSSVLTALRTFWGDYDPKPNDFYKDSTEFKIRINFSTSENYFKVSNLLFDKTTGFLKKPSKSSEFDLVKENTRWSNETYNEFKTERDNDSIDYMYGDVNIEDKYFQIWFNAIKIKLNLNDNWETEICLKCNRDNCKVKYYINDLEARDIQSFLPEIAFIDDTRKFAEEENGKPKTLTSHLFDMIIKNNFNNDVSCSNCENMDCTSCVNELINKQASELSVNELQKLVTYKTNVSSEEITNKITNNFAENYREDFQVNIRATSSLNKSFTLDTKIFDPALDSEISLSNVGAGLHSIYILSLFQAYLDYKIKPAIFLIEEPELYLHPQLQKSMANTLRDITYNSQVVFTTHSPIMLNKFDASEIRQVKLDEQNYTTRIDNTTIDSVLNEIGYTTQDIINKDFVIFVEGKSDKEIFEKLIHKYYNLDVSRISIIGADSCKNLEFYATLKFLNMTTFSDNFFIIRDADTKERELVKSKVNNQIIVNLTNENIDLNGHIYVTKYSSIEGYLINKDILIEKSVFESEEELETTLILKLTQNKQKNITYYTKQNGENHQERIDDFTNSYDAKASNALENIDWLKENIKGHSLFGYLKGRDIDFNTYVNQLPRYAFEDIIEFLNSNEYFSSKYIDEQ